MPEADAISPEQVRLVRSVSRTLARSTDLDVLLLQIAQAAREMLACERASIFLHDAKAGEFWTRIALDSQEIRVSEKTGIVGAAFWKNELLDVCDPYNDPRFNAENDRRTGFRTRNILAAPVAGSDGNPLGVLQAINKKTGAFQGEDQNLLQLLADQAGVAIQRHRFMVDAIRTAALEKEMDLARRVQEAMIPKRPPEVAQLEVAGWTKPASVTGGDVYDLWPMRDGRLGVFLADASGHGLAPTLVVSQVRTLVRTLCEIDSDPFVILARINARMAGDLEAGRFITAFLGFITSDGKLDYCSAGHGPLVVRDSGQSPLRLLDPTLPPLGVLDEMPVDRADPIQLAPGGALFVLSDGIFEARNAKEEMFEIDLVCQILQEHRALSPRQLIDKLAASVLAWQGRDEPADDQTIVIAAPKAPPPPPDEA
jgi:serine phosphatase RsbU (regulator of sigma subunit)